MGRVINIERKSAVLKHPALPCLSKYHTLNLTAGCPFLCRYCYAQSFRNHPGPDKILFYANTFDRLRQELPRKRKKPVLVYFSTACEPFAPDRQILECLYQCMELLLDHSVFILISTKSSIPNRFLRLFGKYPGMVSVQVGLTTSDDQVRQVLEPRAPAVQRRLATLRALGEFGISRAARMDPLVPELTDTRESFRLLCDAVRQTGTKSAVASYLFLRRVNWRSLDITFHNWSFRDMADRLYTEHIEEYCGGGAIRIPSGSYRQSRYEHFNQIAASCGLGLRLCQCKNPDLTTECCHPTPPFTSHHAKQQRLFG